MGSFKSASIAQAAIIAAVTFVLANVGLTAIKTLQHGSPPSGQRHEVESEAHRSMNRNSNSDEHEATSEATVAAQNQKPSDEMDDGSSDGKSQKKDIDAAIAKYTFWLVVFTAVLAFTTVLLTIATCGLWNYAAEQATDMKNSIAVAKRSADAARVAAIASKIAADATVAGQRAFVFVLQNTYHRQPDGRWWFSPVWGNSGVTPTKSLHTHVRFISRETPLPDDFDFHYASGPEDISTAFLGPHTNIQGARLPLGGIAASDVIAAQNGAKFLYILGWAKYSDVFPGSKEHITRFCSRIDIIGDPNGPKERVSVSFTPHRKNNCADEGCDE